MATSGAERARRTEPESRRHQASDRGIRSTRATRRPRDGTGIRRRTAALATILAGLAGCAAFEPHPLAPGGASIGTTNDGWIADGIPVPLSADGLRSYRDAERRFGTPRIVEMLLETAAWIDERFPGTVLRVGDLSARSGGKIPGHQSHRAGRDVDLLFFAVEPDGTASGRSRWAHFASDGVAVGQARPLRLDLERNWALVEHLLVRHGGAIQWIFVSTGVRSALLSHALRAGADPLLLLRALEVLQQPSDSSPHDDHYHVRLYCDVEERAYGCLDRPPIRSWVRPDHDRFPRAPIDDAFLLERALEEL